MKIGVIIFNIEKYRKDWKDWIATQTTPKFHNWYPITPLDRSYSGYVEEITVETEKFIKHPITDEFSVWSEWIEIDGDYLYKDKVTDRYDSHESIKIYYEELERQINANKDLIPPITYERLLNNKAFSTYGLPLLIERDKKLKKLL